MAHPKETREKLRRLYVSDGQTLEIAAMMCEIPTATARSWKRAAKETGDDWDKVRAAYTLAGGGIEDLSRSLLAGFLVQYQSTMTMLQDTSVEELMPSERSVGERLCESGGESGVLGLDRLQIGCDGEDRSRKRQSDAGNVKIGDGD